MLGAASANAAGLSNCSPPATGTGLDRIACLRIDNVGAIVQDLPAARNDIRRSQHSVRKTRAKSRHLGYRPVAKQQSPFRIGERRRNIPIRKHDEIVPLIEIRIAAVRLRIELLENAARPFEPGGALDAGEVKLKKSPVSGSL